MKTPFHTIRLAILALGSLAFLSARTLAAPAKYNVTDLGTLGGDTSHGYGINASGQVAGQSQTTGNAAYHAARWTGTKAVDLGVTIGGISDGVGINAAGQLTGTYYLTTGNFSSQAVRWTGTKAVILGPRSVDGDAINTSGQVSGSYDALNDGYTHAARWTGTTAEDLGTLGGSFSFGLGINDSGQVAGESSLPFPNTDVFHAVRWTGTTAVDLGTLGGSTSRGNAINTSGQVAGSADLTNNSASHATRWTGTTPTDLGTLGGTTSHGYAINASGQVTGMSDISPTLTTQHAFLYTSGKMYDLETLLVSGSGVTELVISYQGNNINDLGQIAATGRVNGGSQHALLLTPVPGINFAITGATNNGAIIHFTASTGTGLDVRVQSRIDQQGWNDLPDGNGAKMTESTTTPGDYTLDSTFYPPGTAISFRAIASKLNTADIISVKRGPYTLTRAVLSIDVQAKTNTDKVHGTVTRAGDDLTYTFTVINSGSATARDLKVIARVPSYIENQTNLNKQFALADIPLDSSSNPKISSGGVFHAATNVDTRDAKIIWDAGELLPGAQFSEAFTIHITSNVRTLQNIGMPNDYLVYGANYQPPYAATGYSSGSPNIATEVRGPISFTATALSTVVAPGGLITYKFKLANLTNTAVTHAVAIVSVPEHTRYATTYPKPSGGSVFGVEGVNTLGMGFGGDQVFAAGLSAPQILIDAGPLAAAGDVKDTVTLNVTFQAQWVDPAVAPEIGALDYYAAFFNGDLFKNPYNPTGPQITQYDLFLIKFNKSMGTTSTVPGSTDFISFINLTSHEIALSHQDSGDVSVPISGSVANQPGFILWKTISNKATATVTDGSSVVDTAAPGDKLTFLFLASNNGKSMANDVYIEDGLPDHTSFINGTAHLLGTSTSTTASKLLTYPDADGHHVRFEGMNLLPGDGVVLEYSVLVDSGVAAGTLILPAAVLDPVTGLPTGGVGASSIGSSSTPHTSEGYFLNGAIKVTGTFQLAQPEIHVLVPSPVVSTDINVTANALTAVYNKNWSAKPQTNQTDYSTLIPGAERYYIHYENLGKVAVQGAQLVFPLPAHTAFYRASFVRLTSGDDAGVLINTPNGSTIVPPVGASNGFLSTGGNTTFTFNQLAAAGQPGYKGDVMVEVIVMSDAVTTKSPLIGVGASPVFIRDTPITQKITTPMPIVKVATPPAPAAVIASNTAGPMATATSVADVPKVGIWTVVPNEVKVGEQFQVEVNIFNNGYIGAHPVVEFTIPKNTKFISASAGKSLVLSPVATGPGNNVEAVLASNNGILLASDLVPLQPRTGAGMTITLQATGTVCSEITYSTASVIADYMGKAYAPQNITRIVDSPKIGLSAVITGAPLLHKIVNGTDVFVVNLTDAGDKIMVLGAASIVGQGGGNIVAQGGGNIVAQGGGNIIVSGASSLIPIGGTTGAGIVAQGGGNIIVPQGSTIVAQGGGNLVAAGGGIVAQGGGNIVAQGGGNIVAQGGGNIVAQGGGNIVAQGGGNIVSINGSNIFAAGGGGIVAQGGGNLISLPGTSASFTTQGGNVMGTGSSNFRPIP